MIKPVYYLFIAWLIALVALIATLFGSEIMHLPVCTLCWYQRIAIYPLVIILGIGAYQNDLNTVKFALPFPILGFIFAAYQYAEQMIPGFSPIKMCQQGVACSDIHIKIAGFVTLPFLSMIACLVIFFCLILSQK